MSSKRPNWTRPFGLAIALTVLTTAVYWLEFKKKPQNQKEEEKQKKVFFLDEAQVQGISLVQGISKIDLNCLDLSSKQCLAGKNSKWEITYPSKLKGDETNIQALLSSLNNLIPSDSIRLEHDSLEKKGELLAQYGLSPDQRRASQRVTVTDESGIQTSLVLGDVHPLGEARFALIEQGSKDKLIAKEDRVLLIPSWFKETIAKPLTHWRDKKILTIQASDIVSIEFSGAKGGFQANKKDGQWTLKGKDSLGTFSEMQGDIENIDNWSSATAYLTARDFAAENKRSSDGRKILVGAKAVLKISLARAKESPIQLELFELSDKKGQRLFLTASNLDPVFELEPSARQRLEKSAQDFRLSRLLGSMDRFNSHEVSFRSKALGESPIVFKKKEGKWTRLSKTSSPSPSDEDAKVTSLLDQLSGSRIKTVLPSKKPGKDALEIALKNDQEKVVRKLEFWREGNQLFARDHLSRRAETLELDASLGPSLPWDKL